MVCECIDGHRTFFAIEKFCRNITTKEMNALDEINISLFSNLVVSLLRFQDDELSSDDGDLFNSSFRLRVDEETYAIESEIHGHH